MTHRIGKLAAVILPVALALVLAVAAGARSHATAGEVAPGVGQETVTIVITDSGMQMSTTTVRRGSVRFEVRNNASVPYEIEIEGPGVDYDSRDIPAGETRSVMLDLRPGRYEVEAEAEAGPDREWKAILSVRG